MRYDSKRIKPFRENNLHNFGVIAYMYFEISEPGMSFTTHQWRFCSTFASRHAPCLAPMSSIVLFVIGRVSPCSYFLVTPTMLVNRNLQQHYTPTTASRGFFLSRNKNRIIKAPRAAAAAYIHYYYLFFLFVRNCINNSSPIHKTRLRILHHCCHVVYYRFKSKISDYRHQIAYRVSASSDKLVGRQ